ncbi:hypothetical protein [Amycolatopsis sp. NPDC057786]|uniref:hypothetical protein n=1 Tax=Amycolatopsis sp. NPDC057786 TaxID=3346250 RepID=UPI003672774E
MPLVEITYAPHLPEAKLRELGSVLPHLVSVAVECPEEPYDGDLQPGDVELRFRTPGPFDRFGLDLLVEARSKWFPSRVDLLRTSIEAATGIDDVGVYLSLPVAAWSQSD